VILTSTTAANSLLTLLLEYLPNVVIIIDGIDELDVSQRKLLLTLLNSHVKQWDEREPGKLRVMLVSQQIADIDKALEMAARLSLSPQDNENDIRVFVISWCEKILTKYKLDNVIMEYIKESTCQRSEGMLSFLYVKILIFGTLPTSVPEESSFIFKLV